MAIYLVQHGISHSEETDPERRLTDEGRALVESVASEAAAKGVRVSSVFHSGKTRARQTAEILARYLCTLPPAALDGMNPNDPVAKFAGKLNAGSGAMYVGHLPFMERLASFLLTGSESRPIVSFQNGGIVCLDAEVRHGGWTVRWIIVPRYSIE